MRFSRASYWSPASAPDEEAEAGTVNMLCADHYTDMGAGATYQSTWLEVSAANQGRKAQ